jgi:hypothetical protein
LLFNPQLGNIELKLPARVQESIRQGSPRRLARTKAGRMSRTVSSRSVAEIDRPAQ